MLVDTSNNNYYSMQGDILLAKRDASGNPGPFWMIGNSPKCELSFEVERRKHQESRSGQRLVDKVQSKTKGGKVSFTIEDIRKDNMALVLGGKKVTVASGSYTGSTYDVFPTVAVGSIVQLAKRNVSSLVLKDSTTPTPATPALGTHYEVLDAGHGLIRILNLGAFIQPLRAQYSYAATDVITALEAGDDDEYYMYVAGNNTEASPDQRIGGSIYRVVFDPAKLLALINEEQGSFDIQGEVLKDLVRSADANFGGFARLEYIDANM